MQVILMQIMNYANNGYADDNYGMIIREGPVLGTGQAELAG